MDQTAVAKNTEKTLSAIHFIMLVLSAFFISFSTALANIFLGLSFIGAVLLILQKEKMKTILHDLPSVFFIIIFLIILFRGLYDFGNSKDNFRTLIKYRELILFPFLALSFNLIDQFYRKIIINSFVLGIFIVAIISILAGIGVPGFRGLSVTPFAPSIFQGVATAIAIYFSVLLMLEEKKILPQIFYIIMAILAFVDVFYFVNGGRTGYLCMFALIILLGYRIFNIKGLLLGFATAVTLFVFLFLTSDVFRGRLMAASQEYKLQIVEGQIQEEEKKTSIGSRLEFWHNSLTIIQHHPFFGAGNFPNAYKKAALENGYKITQSTNPHQDFLLLGAMIGIPGALLYIISLVWMINRCNLFKEHSYRNYYLLGVVTTLVIMSFFNSPILDSREGNLFLLLLSMTYSFSKKSLAYD